MSAKIFNFTIPEVSIGKLNRYIRCGLIIYMMVTSRNVFSDVLCLSPPVTSESFS